VGQSKASIDHRAEPEEEAKGPAGGMLGIGKSLVPEKYADARTSGLSLDVQSGQNEFNIEMTE
jgi:hypothetical protein